MAAIRDRTRGFDYYEEEEPLSVAQQHLKQLLRKQLSTKTKSVESALGQSREFAPAVTFKPLESEVQGLHSLEHYQTKKEEHSRVDELRELGLTSEEIELKLSYEEQDHPGPNPTKKMRVTVEPAAQLERIQALEKKISSREELLDAPLRFKGAHQLSRHAMQVENSLFRYQGSTLTQNPLIHLTVEDHQRHVVYPSKVIPATNSSTKCHVEDILAGKNRYQGSTPIPTEDGTAPGKGGGVEGCGGDDDDEVRDIPPLPLEVLERNSLSEAEIRALPRFADYTPGEPSKTLYLKNMHHAVTSEDLEAVFGHLRAVFGRPSIRLMKGRMRGQAFVQFSSVDGAVAGLSSANGFIMRGRPLIINYGHATCNKEMSSRPKTW